MDAFYQSQPDIELNEPFTYGSIALMCLTEAGSARVTGVRLREAFGDISVRQFVAVRYPVEGGGIGAMRGALASLVPQADSSKPQVVDTLCPNVDQSGPWPGGYEVIVEVVRTNGDIAGARALDIEYETNGRTDVVTLPIGVSLCARECPPPDLWPPMVFPTPAGSAAPSDQ